MRLMHLGRNMTEVLNAIPDTKMQECSVLTCAYEALLL